MNQKIKISQVGRVITGKTPPTKQNELYGYDYPFITPTDIDEDSRFVRTERYLSREGFEYQKQLLLPEGAVCYVCIASIGKICITSEPSFTNQQINSIIVNSEKFDRGFIYYKLKNETARIKNMASGVAAPIINKTMFSDIELTVPSLTLQEKIALLLLSYDNLIENNNRRIKILEEIAQTIYVDWFVKFCFPGHGKVKMVDSELGKIPEGWEVASVKQAVKRLKSGKTYTQNKVLPEGQVPVIDQSRKKFLGFHNDEPAHFASPDNPKIIFGDHTCKMQIMVEPFSLGPNVIPFVSQDGFSISYLFFTVRQLVQTREYKRHWNELIIKKIVTPVPEVQSAYTEIVTPMLEEISLLLKKNLRLESMRDILLPKLISGEIDVEGMDIDIGETDDR